VIDMPDTNDTLINLSFSMHSGPGTFALLLGSGISQGAGIPTGWDIVLDLIRKLAVLEGEIIPENPEAWFWEKYHEEPNYSFLIEKVAPSSIARRNLLKLYIEPTEVEREQGLKVPSLSHKAIAQLVKNGTIRVILTTNIDQLLETSLKEVGVTPIVILNDDSLEGAIPYVHSECTIIKLHGDYLDTRIKNTPEELAHYSEKINSHLDRILEEFGLVICGWSANWDIALRDALYRRHNRRFSTYWVYRQVLSSDASMLKDHLQAITLQIETADKFFHKCSENIEALKTFERPHPLSVPLAVAQVKKYIAEEKYHIILHDFLQDDTNRLCNQLKSDRFRTSGLQIPRDQYKRSFQNRMHVYEELLKTSIGIFSTYVFFGITQSPKPVISLIERLLETPCNSGDSRFVNLQYYPAYVLNYSCGIAALNAENYPALFSIITKPQFHGNGRPQTSLQLLNVWHVFDHDAHKLVPTPQEGTSYYTPVSDYLCKFLYGEMKNVIPDRRKFEVTFDLFEYLFGLTYVDQNFPDLTHEGIHGSIGRFKWKYRLYGLADRPSPIEEFFQHGISQGNNWRLLKAGFFSGSVERLTACKTAYDAYLNIVGQHWH
jgi:hypothetical protein